MESSPFEALPDKPAVSPSGKYVLHVSLETEKNQTYYQFRISKNTSNGPEEYVCPIPFYVIHTTWFVWDQSDKVWVYSGDLGIFYWEFKQDHWEKNTYKMNPDVSAPDILNKRRPKYFTH